MEKKSQTDISQKDSENSKNSCNDFKQDKPNPSVEPLPESTRPRKDGPGGD